MIPKRKYNKTMTTNKKRIIYKDKYRPYREHPEWFEGGRRRKK